mmetsp:Transcript_13754/g.20739  ORF Transcript_13754/g.20739 Transcript_13754/m.20739 type:complete len:274 (-) Transcript_13754:57-878(-)|eukprot:CAMPEP_0202692688 /NCGR_PEP_ID=MMETSP1385-20130828/7004_1 /ASSEMBLY_ACC=CAM_ASM_000861 /TAXON_ID=933848 /ORGANISM="Elphidium margaritaceum" /LENGTH=273 /DNA_ID=CAMNT_0049348267 /DNA_START=120 /DNA_END=941 /DNA_ORIENTATION=-
MTTKPYTAVKKDETEAVAQDEKEAEDKDDEKEEKVENLDPLSRLHYSCRRGDIEGIRNISSQVTDINAKDETGTKANAYKTLNTALHFAVLSGSLQAVQVTFDLGASINATNKLGCTPLHIAASMGYTEIAKFLLEKKADREPRNLIQNTPLHCAVYACHVDTVRIILDHADNKREALLNPVNGIGFAPYKYCAKTDESMKEYLRSIFPVPANKNSDDQKIERDLAPTYNHVEEEEAAPAYETTQNGHENDGSDDANETTALKTGTGVSSAEQ